MSQVLFKSRQLIMALLSVCLFHLGVSSVAFANEEKTAPIKIPTTIPAVWQAIDEHTAAIDKLITTNEFATIHAHAFAIRDLVAALPALSNDLSSEQMAALKRDAGYVSQLAVRLDKTGDANDKEGTVANFNKLKKILGQIRANYTLK